ncbi:MAG: polyprenyl synthetase family protein [bacterium]|nr:polyprenyl synthetase family protein [bacterium]
MGQSLESRISERIYHPTVRMIYSEFVRLGHQELTTRILESMPVDSLGPIEQALATHVHKEKSVIAQYIGDSLGADHNQTQIVATACDLLWGLSLLYDDVIDDDQIRAGMPTSWVRYGKQRTMSAVYDGVEVIVKLLQSRVNPETTNACSHYVQQGIDSYDEISRITFDSPLNAILMNYIRRCNFHQAFPVIALFRYIGTNNPEKESVVLEALQAGNQAGQLINDLKDCSVMTFGREPFRDVENGVTTIPIKLLWDQMDSEEKYEYLKLHGKDGLNSNDVRILNYLFTKYYVAEQCKARIVEGYTVF